VPNFIIVGKAVARLQSYSDILIFQMADCCHVGF